MVMVVRVVFVGNAGGWEMGVGVSSGGSGGRMGFLVVCEDGFGRSG
jgi:hypothetical protein